MSSLLSLGTALQTECRRISGEFLSTSCRGWRRSSGAVSVAAAVTIQPEVAELSKEENLGAVLLEVKGLRAVVADSGKEILNGVDLIIREGEVGCLNCCSMLILGCHSTSNIN